jgi:hypothetical protein
MNDMHQTVAELETTHGGPEAPNITNKHIWAQFKLDIAGKEVQIAETYSHSWVANQFGHVCLGILLAGLFGIVLGSGLSAPWETVVGCLLASLIAAAYEWRAFRIAVANATGQFPLGRKLLRDNALIATAYMVLGVAITFIDRFFVLTPGNWLGARRLVWAGGLFVGVILLGIGLALPWLRQKIVWQKAGLPYLFRLAEAPPTMDDDDAKKLYGLINSEPPPKAAACPIVIGGPIASGRTELCAGIGTEFAFRHATVRYLSLATLLEFAARSEPSEFFDDEGPKNIAYWSWSKAQVVIIDDIGPLLAPAAPPYSPIGNLRQVLTQLHPISGVLARCHTVWVIGDPSGDGQIAKDDRMLDQFAEEIRSFCTIVKGRPPAVLVAQLDHGAADRTVKSPRVRTRYLS